jgi:hypothetical protein
VGSHRLPQIVQLVDNQSPGARCRCGCLDISREGVRRLWCGTPLRLEDKVVANVHLKGCLLRPAHSGTVYFVHTAYLQPLLSHTAMWLGVRVAWRHVSLWRQCSLFSCQCMLMRIQCPFDCLATYWREGIPHTQPELPFAREAHCQVQPILAALGCGGFRLRAVQPGQHMTMWLNGTHTGQYSAWSCRF